MGADDEEVGVCAAVEFGEASVVIPHPFSIMCNQGLRGGEDTRNVRVPVECAVVIKSVAAVQHPTVAGIDCHAGMTAGVAGKGDKHYPGGDLIELFGSSEPSPFLPIWIVFDDVGAVFPLGGAKPQLLASRR